MPGPVTIRRYRDLPEALVARSMLEAFGIAAFLCDENFVRIDWRLSAFIGGMRLQVSEVDQADARELLRGEAIEKSDEI